MYLTYCNKLSPSKCQKTFYFESLEYLFSFKIAMCVYLIRSYGMIKQLFEYCFMFFFCVDDKRENIYFQFFKYTYKMVVQCQERKSTVWRN